MKVLTGNESLFGFVVSLLLLIVAVPVKAEGFQELESDIFGTIAELPAFEAKVLLAKKVAVVVFIHAAPWSPQVTATVNGTEHAVWPIGSCVKRAPCYGVPDPQDENFFNFRKRFVYVFPAASTNVTIDSHPTELREGVFVHQKGKLRDVALYSGDDNKNTKIVPVVFSSPVPVLGGMHLFYSGGRMRTWFQNKLRMTSIALDNSSVVYMAAVAQPRKLLVNQLLLKTYRTSTVVNLHDSEGLFPKDTMSIFLTLPSLKPRFLTEKMWNAADVVRNESSEMQLDVSTPEDGHYEFSPREQDGSVYNLTQNNEEEADSLEHESRRNALVEASLNKEDNALEGSEPGKESEKGEPQATGELTRHYLALDKRSGLEAPAEVVDDSDAGADA